MPDFSNPYVLGITITEYIVFILLCVINTMLYKKYQERHNPVARQLLFAFFFFSLGPVLQSQDTLYGDTLTILYMGYIASFGYSAAMLSAGIANYYILDFANMIFNRAPNKKNNLLAWVDISIVSIFFILKSLNQGLISTVVMGLHILVSFIIFGYLILNSFKIAKRMETLLEKRSFNFIGLNGIFLILMYGCFVIEALFFYGTYSFFGMLGWIMGFLGVFFAYLGYCRPMWLTRIYTPKQSNKSQMAPNL